MGRKCYKSYSCSPCYNPCCPPFLGPCCPPPCCPPPCVPFCNPCYGSEWHDSYDEKHISYFVASSVNTLDISGNSSPYTIPFTEQQDCLCEYVNDSTFIPKCKGYYKFNATVTVNNNSDTSQLVTVAIVVNGVPKSSLPMTIQTNSSYTFSLTPSICLTKGNTVYVTITPTSSISLGNRSFNGSKCGRSGSCSSSCCC